MAYVIESKDRFSGDSQLEHLLTTKLYIPRIVPDNISRHRLNKLLSEGVERKLTLVCAPAGYGKSTLLAEWLSGYLPKETKKAWLSLDENDNDQALFWRYFIAAFERIRPGIGKKALELLDLPESPPIISIMALLINAIDKEKSRFVLVLDDYHFIRSKSIHSDMTFFIHQLPENMHIVVASRTEPPLGLSTLRARHQLNEISLNDLRFTSSEAEEFYTKSIDIKLSNDDVAALDLRTEGWVAGIRLASLSLKTLDDPEQFIRNFTGNSSFVIDYLGEEVMQKQPKDIQIFLMQTSILENFNVYLCNAVTGLNNADEFLEYLRKQNLFMISLDDKRNWYRYHHLFSSFLHERLKRMLPAGLDQLHYRASRWYEKNGFIKEALHHALAINDYRQASRLVEKNTELMLTRGEIKTTARWLERLPEELISSSIRLSLAHAWVLGKVTDFFRHAQESQCRLDIALQRLRDVSNSLGISLEKLLEAVTNNFADQELISNLLNVKNKNSSDTKSILGEIFAIYAIIMARQGNINNTIIFSNLALRFLSENTFLCAVVNLWLGKVHHLNNNMEDAKAATVRAVEISRQISNIYYLIGSMSCLADIEFMQGNLREAANIYKRLLKIANEQGGRTFPVTVLACMELGWLLYEWNELDDAMYHMHEAIELAKEAKDNYLLANGYLGLAQVMLALGDKENALDLNCKAECLVAEHDLKSVDSSVEAQRAEISLLNGEYRKVAHWAKKHRLNVADESASQIHFGRLMHYCLFARMYISQGNVAEAIRLLDGLLSLVEKLDRPEYAKWLLKVRALAHYKNGDLKNALQDIQQTLAIAEAGMHIRFFLSEGEPMLEMLLTLLKLKNQEVVLGFDMEKDSCSEAYIKELIFHFEQWSQFAPEKAKKSAGKFTHKKQLSEKVVTPREIEILRYLEAGLPNKEIAEKLFISPGTVKRHLENIYEKLDVTSRARAIIRAKELGYL